MSKDKQREVQPVSIPRAEPVTYKIRVQGVLDSQTVQVEGLRIDTPAEADAPTMTTLTGAFQDEDALENVFDQLYTLGLPLISVERVEADRAEPAGDPSARRLTMMDPATYLIQVRGWADESWIEYLDNFSIVVTGSIYLPPGTTLRGRVHDQTALLGVLHQLRQFGTTLISVDCLDV
jgi:hypothetical protein